MLIYLGYIPKLHASRYVELISWQQFRLTMEFETVEKQIHATTVKSWDAAYFDYHLSWVSIALLQRKKIYNINSRTPRRIQFDVITIA